MPVGLIDPCQRDRFQKPQGGVADMQTQIVDGEGGVAILDRPLGIRLARGDVDLWCIEGSEDIGDKNCFRRLGEIVTAAGAFLGANQSGLPQPREETFRVRYGVLYPIGEPDSLSRAKTVTRSQPSH